MIKNDQSSEIAINKILNVLVGYLARRRWKYVFP